MQLDNFIFCLLSQLTSTKVRNLPLGANTFLYELTLFGKLKLSSEDTGSHKGCSPFLKWQKHMKVILGILPKYWLAYSGIILVSEVDNHFAIIT